MGSEHSTHSNLSSTGLKQQNSLNNEQKLRNFRKQQTMVNPGEIHDNSDLNMRGGSISPGPSVCSDTDLPYISYTVNRPIGDSPKLTNKQIVKQQPKRKIQKIAKKSSSHNIVVVKSASGAPNSDKDPDVVRLQNIPMFLPIMRATLSLPAARDPEVLERLDPAPLHKLCVKYQNNLTQCANLIATEQNSLTQKIREVDQDINKIVAQTVEKQKKFAKYAENFAKVQELSHQLNRCHMMLNQTLESMETLNNFLDIDDRLEPFVWTTG